MAEHNEIAFTPDSMLDEIKGMWTALRELKDEKAVEAWFLSQSEEQLSRLYAAAAGLHIIVAMIEHDLQKAYGMKTGHDIQMDGIATEGGAVVARPAQRHESAHAGKDVLSALFGGNSKPKQVA